VKLRAVSAIAALVLPAAAIAGPPFLTDDPEPTELGHWEIYAPLLEASGTGSDYEGGLGAELNYGLVKDVQLTVGVSGAFAHSGGRTKWGAGDLEASVKYRFFRDERRGVQIAAFPGITLPTGSNAMSAGRVTALLPVWVQKDSGRWSVFGGGGYAINPGPGNKDFWTGGVALTHQFDDRLTVGLEADREGASEVGGRGTTSLGLGAIYDFPGPLRLLASGGPAFNGANSSSFHAFLALGIDY
jgi:hypothetical protein